MFKMLEHQLQNKDGMQGAILVQTQDKLNSLQKEITYREGEIDLLRMKIREREMHCDAALVSDTINKYNVNKL